MGIVHWILIVVLGFFVIGIIYWFWGMIGGLLMAGAVSIGYGLGKFIGIKPRSEAQMNALVFINAILQIGIEWGLGIWAIALIISFNTEAAWLNVVKTISGSAWFYSLIADILILFLIGLIFGKVQSLEKLEIDKSQDYKQEQAIHCPECGKINVETAIFCKHCGQKLKEV